MNQTAPTGKDTKNEQPPALAGVAGHMGAAGVTKVTHGWCLTVRTISGPVRGTKWLWFPTETAAMKAALEQPDGVLVEVKWAARVWTPCVVQAQELRRVGMLPENNLEKCKRGGRAARGLGGRPRKAARNAGVEGGRSGAVGGRSGMPVVDPDDF